MRYFCSNDHGYGISFCHVGGATYPVRMIVCLAYKPADNILLLKKILHHDLYHLVRVRGGGVRTKNMVDVRCVLKGGNCPLNAYVEQRKS